MTEEDVEYPNCPKCGTQLKKIEKKMREGNYDYECQKCHAKFELLKMELKYKKDKVQRHYKLRGERIIKEK